MLLKAQSKLEAIYVDSNQNRHEGIVNIRKSDFKNKIVFYNINNEAFELNPENTLSIDVAKYGRYVSGIVPNVFAEVLIEGKANLYTINREFYIIKGGQLYHLLNRGIQWKGILKIIVSDSAFSGMYSESSLQYNQSDISNIIAKYNEQEGNLTFNSKALEDKTSISIGPQVGYVYAMMVFDNIEKLPNTAYSFGIFNGNFHSLGFSINLKGKLKSQFFELKFNPIFTREKYAGTDSTFDAVYSNYSSTNVSLNSYLLPLLVKYNFFKNERLYHFVNFGLGARLNKNKYFTAQVERVHKTVQDYSLIYDYDYTNFMKKTQMFLMLGYTYQKQIKENEFDISLDLYYISRPTAIQVKSYVPLVQLSLSYRFKL
ncbi:MAG TPA: hypothetical protein PKD85_05465 [Saprospiraceae bacterium]|nr:hypothetical protein [Saprospiraceae bacterium]